MIVVICKSLKRMVEIASDLIRICFSLLRVLGKEEEAEGRQ
jgi:hypothetical protein